MPRVKRTKTTARLPAAHTTRTAKRMKHVSTFVASLTEQSRVVPDEPMLFDAALRKCYQILDALPEPESA